VAEVDRGDMMDAQNIYTIASIFNVIITFVVLLSGFFVIRGNIGKATSKGSHQWL